MKILLTGGAGFIGSHLVDKLIAEKHKVIIIDNLSTGRKENINPQAKFYRCDIASLKASEIIKKEKPEVISHFFWRRKVKDSITTLNDDLCI
ncbi:MAG: NAD-dependent epimerase/dehydratase family protein [Parcubacteria group bacterium]|nr:NAD-dependent epimerase/dehydratase family protein [Parcubacteria group bacterium]